MSVRGSRLTGSRDAIFLHNKYQKALEDAYANLVSEIEHVENVNRRKMLGYYHQSLALKEDLKACLTEYNTIEESLNDLLEKEFGQEYKMWKENTQGLNIRTTQGFQNNVVGILGQVVSSPTLKYLERYPQHSSHPSIEKDKERLGRTIKDIRGKAESYNKAVADYNHELPFYSKNASKCQDNFDRYNEILQEGSDRIENSRYVKSIMFRILPEDKKAEILLDTIRHTMDKWENVLAMFKDDLSKYKKQFFEELSY